MMRIEELFKEIGIEENLEDLHITRMHSSFAAVSEGKVIGVTDSYLRFCLLANFLYFKGVKE